MMHDNKNDEVLLHKHILLCGDNLNSLGIIRSLGEMGICPIVIVLSEGHIPLVEKSRYVGRVFKTKSFDESYDTLLKFGNAQCKPFVYTSDDNHESLLDTHYDELIQLFYFFNAGGKGRVTQMMNKNTLCDMASSCGFIIPQKEEVTRGTLPKKIKYPIITKTLNPYAPGWKRDVGIYHSDVELMDAYQGMISERLLLQEYIEKKNEFEIHGFSIDGGKQVYLSYFSLYYRFSPTSFGFYKYYQQLKDGELELKIKKLVRAAQYTGVFEVEFLVDKDEQLVFLEINFREALSNYACTYGNVNLPFLWAKSMLTGKIDSNTINPDKTFFKMMNEESDFIQSVRNDKMHLSSWLRELRNADCLLLYNKEDNKPFYSYLVKKIFQSLKKHLIH